MENKYQRSADGRTWYVNGYELQVRQYTDNGGGVYYTAFFPSISGCVGGGDTPEEAISEAMENYEVFLAYTKGATK